MAKPPPASTGYPHTAAEDDGVTVAMQAAVHQNTCQDQITWAAAPSPDSPPNPENSKKLPQANVLFPRTLVPYHPTNGSRPMVEMKMMENLSMAEHSVTEAPGDDIGNDAPDADDELIGGE
jgi:hypothetical protein